MPADLDPGLALRGGAAKGGVARTAELLIIPQTPLADPENGTYRLDRQRLERTGKTWFGAVNGYAYRDQPEVPPAEPTAPEKAELHRRQRRSVLRAVIGSDADQVIIPPAVAQVLDL